MSPLKPVTIRMRRGMLALAVLAVPALPAAAWLVASQVSDNARLTQAIQEQRRDSILRSCQEQNMRHDNTIQTLDKLIARVPASRRVRAKQGRANTILLIDALAPKRDCERLVARTAPIPKQ